MLEFLIDEEMVNREDSLKLSAAWPPELGLIGACGSTRKARKREEAIN